MKYSFFLLTLSPAPCSQVPSTLRCPLSGAQPESLGLRFPLEDPFFQEQTQATDFGLAFVSTVWRWVN